MKSFLKLNILLILMSISIYSQNNAKQVLSALQDKYKTVKDFSVDFKQSVNDKVNFSGRLTYAKENKIRVELNKSTIISDGKSVWNYNKSKNQVVINNSEGTNNSFFNVDKFLYDYPSKCSIDLQKESGKNILVLTPEANSSVDFRQAKIWVNSDNLASKIIVENSSGTTMQIDLSNYSINKNLEDSKFSFSPPEGTKIIDLRK